MQVIHGTNFTASRAWDARDITVLDGTSIRLHWTDRPYHWHVNDGEEVFVVLDGAIDMHVRDTTGEHIIRLVVGDIFHAGPGAEHVAHPLGVARVLVMERAGSV